MRGSPAVVFATLLAGSFVLRAAPARAEWEISGAIGGISGGDLNALDADEVRRSFESSELYGARLAWIGYPFGVEASFVTSPSGLSGAVALPADLPVSVDEIAIETRVSYGEANLFVAPFPGPVTPVLTAGVGIHTFDFDVAGVLQTGITKLGYNFGGGLRIHLGQVTLRADVRDHTTTVGLDDFGLGSIAQVIGVEFEDTVHNVEISVGIGVRF
jgi:hypothetical protein